MNKEQFNITQADPQLPQVLKEAKRNHGGMTVPADFFAQFEKKMNAVIDADVMANQPTIGKQETTTVTVSRRWAIVAAAVAVIAVLGIAIQLDWFGSQVPEQTDLMANGEIEEEELNPAEDIYYTSLSDYEVYDLICGI